MPTPLTKPVVRRDPRKGIVVRLSPEGLFIRESGRRTWYGPLDYGRLLLQGARDYVAEQKARKAAERKARRAAQQAVRATTKTTRRSTRTRS